MLVLEIILVQLLSDVHLHLRIDVDFVFAYWQVHIRLRWNTTFGEG